MKTLQDLLSLKQPVDEAYDQDEMEAMHSASADEYHSGSVSIAETDGFSVEQDAEDPTWVHILDDENTIRLTMEKDEWMELCRDTLHRHVKATT